MPIDLDIALGAALPDHHYSWTQADVLLYHLGIGAGADPTNPDALRYVEETDLRVLPTFATVVPTLRDTEPPSVSFPGISIDLAKVVHASQSVTVTGPIPTEGSVTYRGRVSDIQDKGSAAVVFETHDAVAADGTVLWTSVSSLFAKGEGGFGGDRGASTKTPLPDRGPDVTLDVPTLPQQALLYRLLGDRNPLHSNPDFAAAAGFPAPILHGRCTYGLACRAATDALLGLDAHRVRGFSARFSGVVYPGETLRIELWHNETGAVGRVTCPDRDHARVLDDVVLTAM